MSVSDGDRREFRQAECPACGRPVRWMRGADRPDCPYCGRRAGVRKAIEMEVDDDVETEVSVTWQ